MSFLLWVFLLSTCVATSYYSDPPLAPTPKPLSLHTYLLNRSYFQAQTVTGRPFEWCFLDAHVSSKQLRLVIDTAAVESYMDPDLAIENGIAFIHEKRQPFNQKDRSKLVVDLDIANHRFIDTSFHSLRCRSFVESQPTNIVADCGIVGLDFLRRHRAVLDYRFQRLYLAQPDTSTTSHRLKVGSERSAVIGPLAEIGWVQGQIVTGKRWGRWYLSAKINGKRLVFLLDSGSACNILFPVSAKTLGYKLKEAIGYLPSVVR